VDTAPAPQLCGLGNGNGMEEKVLNYSSQNEERIKELNRLNDKINSIIMMEKIVLMLASFFAGAFTVLVVMEIARQ